MSVLKGIDGTTRPGFSIGTTDGPSPRAALDVVSTDKGVLLPRLTTAQRLAIATPEAGLLLFDTDVEDYMRFDGTSWGRVGQSNYNDIVLDDDGRIVYTGDGEFVLKG